MSVRIRLRRIGKKKEPHYRVVVADAQAARQGRFIETIGYLNPRTDPPQVRLEADKARAWLLRGAQPSDTVKTILIRQGILDAGAGKILAEEVSADASTDRDGGEGPG